MHESTKREHVIDNSWVVPYNPVLLLRFECHLNVEIITTVGVMKYLFKYINKGDNVTAFALKEAMAEAAADNDNVAVAEARQQLVALGSSLPAAAVNVAPTGQLTSDVAPDPEQKHAETEMPVLDTNADKSSSADVESKSKHDEVTRFRQARYIGPVEAVMMILSQSLHRAQPAVIRLRVHEDGKEHITWAAGDAVAAQNALENSDTMLTRWFALNERETPVLALEMLDAERKKYNKKDLGPVARDTVYSDIPNSYVWRNNDWHRRVRMENWPAIGRMHSVHPNDTERYYLRRVLHYAKGPTEFADLMKFDGVCFDEEPAETFQAVCARMCLLQDDAEWVRCLAEAQQMQVPHRLRRLFCSILLNNKPQNPAQLWEEFKAGLCEDILAERRASQDNRQIELGADMELQCLKMMNDIIKDMKNNETLASVSGLLDPELCLEEDDTYMHDVHAALAYPRDELDDRSDQAYAAMTMSKKTCSIQSRSLSEGS